MKSDNAAILIVLLIVAALLWPRDAAPPVPPDPVNVTDAALLQVVKDYAAGCGQSLLSVDCTGTEDDCHEGLKAARIAARLDAHRREDELLGEAAGDPAKIRAIGEAWLRVAKKLETVR